MEERVRRGSRAAGATRGKAGGVHLSTPDVDALRTLGDGAPALLGDYSPAMPSDDAPTIPSDDVVLSTPCADALAIPGDGDL